MTISRKLAIIITVFLSLALLFTACSKNSDTGNNGSDVGNKVEDNKDGNKEDPNKGKTQKSNLETLVDILLKTNVESKFINNADYANFMYTFSEIYKDDIKNPYNGETSIYGMNRSLSNVRDKDQSLSSYAGSVIVIDNMFEHVKDLDLSTVTYACNEGNKGAVIAVVFQDGFYAYEVDEAGNKKNDKLYYFPEVKKERLKLD
ncbi:MAG: hypothetical protein ACOYWZ_22135 [Bacillota bacterium]